MMSQVTPERYRQTHRDRFATLLRGWLATLPSSGWQGSVADLQAALEAVPKLAKYTFIPSSSALSKELVRCGATICAAGWRIEFRRTAKARTIEFVRAETAA